MRKIYNKIMNTKIADSVMKPKHAIIRKPGISYNQCISSHPLRDTIDIARAHKQHAEYCKILLELGLEIIQLSPDDEHPDSCFVEDTAVIYGRKALITRMKKESRRGEEEAVVAVLKEYMKVKNAVAPATIEGGDIIHLPDRLISGVTERTNLEGVAQMEAWLGVPIDTIVNPSIVHLKSYVTFLGKNTMIATRAYANHPVLKGFNVLVVPENESYAANTLTISETVLMSSNHPNAQVIVKEAGFEVISVETSEFEKCEGALTCLSLLF